MASLPVICAAEIILGIFKYESALLAVPIQIASSASFT